VKIFTFVGNSFHQNSLFKTQNIDVVPKICQNILSLCGVILFRKYVVVKIVKIFSFVGNYFHQNSYSKKTQNIDVVPKLVKYIIIVWRHSLSQICSSQNRQNLFFLLVIMSIKTHIQKKLKNGSPKLMVCVCETL